MFIPKLLLRLLWFFRRTASLFRQTRTFPQLFRFCSDLSNVFSCIMSYVNSPTNSPASSSCIFSCMIAYVHSHTQHTLAYTFLYSPAQYHTYFWSRTLLHHRSAHSSACYRMLTRIYICTPYTSMRKLQLRKCPRCQSYRFRCRRTHFSHDKNTFFCTTYSYTAINSSAYSSCIFSCTIAHVFAKFPRQRKMPLFSCVRSHIVREVGGWGRDPKKCTGRDWGMGSSTI